MCLLLPEKSFLHVVNSLGGIDECYRTDNIKFLSKLFSVEERLVRVRLKDISDKIAKEEKMLYVDNSNKQNNASANNGVNNVESNVEQVPQKKKSFFSRYKR